MGLAYCCSIASLIGFFFYMILAYMAYNKNEVFLEHKAQGLAKANETFELLTQLTVVSTSHIIIRE